MTRLPIFLLALLLASPSLATDRFLAFGDSLTEGEGDPSSPAGYPPKLQKLLKKADIDASVENHGLGGETTFEGLSRLDEVLARGGDYLLLMEGTNDVTLVSEGMVSIESTAANLDAMVSKGKSRGFKVLLGTLIPRPPRARKDSRNEFTQEINWAIYELTAGRNLPFADGWSRFNPFRSPDVFRTLYSSIFDPVGHLNADGYSVLAGLFADQILELDTVPPTPGRFSPFTDTISGVTEFSATLFESANGTGIAFDDTVFEINGEVVATAKKGPSTKKRAALSYKLGRKKVGCRVVLSVSAKDRAEPANERSELLWVYDVEGAEHLSADVDGDCTVDEVDLGQLGRGFGRELGDFGFNLLLDFNDDGIIDGLDLAILASVLGESTN